MKKLFITSMLLAVGCLVHGQEIKIAPVVGINVSTILSSAGFKVEMASSFENPSINYLPSPGFTLGGIADYSLSEELSLRSGLLFTTKGGRIKVNDVFVNGKEQAKARYGFSYLEIPAWVAVRLGNSGLLLTGGPNIGFAVGAKARTKSTYTFRGETDITVDKFPLGIGNDLNNDDVKAVEISFTAGLAKEISVSDRTLELSINVQPSISKWNTSSAYDPSISVRNFVIGFRAAYFLFN